jgi:acyl-CoA synthetase (AMP-forming)/AMP-acid ligase II
MYVVEKIHELALAEPGRPALFYNRAPVSYRMLHQAISGVRARFRQQLAPGRAAALRIDNLLAAWVADLALRTAGLTTVAIRSDADAGSLSGLDVAAIVSFAEDRKAPLGADVLPEAARLTVSHDDLYVGHTDDRVAPLDDLPSAGGHILLTSGTTGRFRMVLVDEAREALGRTVLGDFYQTVEGVLQVSREKTRFNLLGFGLWTIAGYTNAVRSWSNGGAVIIDQRPDAYLSLDTPGITHVLATPALLSLLMRLPEGTLSRNEGLQVIVGAGALSSALAQEVKRRLTPRLAIGLGATETGPWALTPVETDEDLKWHRIHPLRTVEVVGEAGEPLAPGRLGEVRVRQINGVDGYLNDPESTQRFFRDGWFYPGDLGVMDVRGRLSLRGRVTDVLNIMGDKYPAEPVERALRDALGVEGVCAFSEQGVGASEDLHIVIETPEPISEDRLREAAHAHLKGFPTASFHFVDQLPRNHMGKVERLTLRRRLRAPRPEAVGGR